MNKRFTKQFQPGAMRMRRPFKTKIFAGTFEFAADDAYPSYEGGIDIRESPQ